MFDVTIVQSWDAIIIIIIMHELSRVPVGTVHINECNTEL